ncbi:MAG TPA: N-acetyltransferase [candidate division Zixibacteria bacterium]|nr:N-acetyltransferase [candidate division Zixibacteria bacterium]
MGVVKFVLRRIKRGDEQSIDLLCQKCFPEDDAFGIAKSLIEIQHFYVAEELETKKILGFIAFGIYSIDTAHIMILAVEPEYQRKGIGTKIMDYSMDIIEKTPIKRVRLEVKITNIAAIRFYEKLGFETKATFENYYEDKSNAFVMVKIL